MINPAELVEALVTKLRAIPELVAEMEETLAGSTPTTTHTPSE